MKFNNKNKVKLYLISSYIPGSEIDRNCFLALKKAKDFFGIKKILIKPTRKNWVRDDFESLEELIEEFPFVQQFNGGKITRDLFVDPEEVKINRVNILSQNNPTKKSLIYGFPSHELVPLVRHITTHPDPIILYGSGSISKSYYNTKLEGGRKREALHSLGGLLVEVHKNGDHRVHQLMYCEKTKTIELFKWRFTKDKVSSHIPPWLVEGDCHPDECDRKTVNRTYEDVKALKIPNVARHDWFNATTISHHTDSNVEAKNRIFRHIGRLEDELRLVANFFKEAEEKLPKTKFHYVASNHPNHLLRYLTESHRNGKDYVNYDTMIELNAIYFKDKKNFWHKTLNKYAKLSKRKHNFMTESSVLKYKDYFLNFHGHVGNNGGSSSPKGLTKIGKTISGHVHYTCILPDGTATAGTSTPLLLPYTSPAGGSNWNNGNVFLNKNGKINVLVIKNGIGSLLF